MLANLVSNVPRPPGAWLAVVTNRDFISSWVYVEVLTNTDKARIVVVAYFGCFLAMETNYIGLHIEVLR